MLPGDHPDRLFEGVNLDVISQPICEDDRKLARPWKSIELRPVGKLIGGFLEFLS